MSSGYSLQRRLGLGLTLGISVLWLAAAVAAGLIVRNALDRTFDSALEETAQRILPLAAVEIINRDTPGVAQQIPALRAHDEYLAYLVRDAAGQVLLQSHDIDTAIFPTRPRPGFRSTATHRIYGAAAVSDTLFIEVAEPLAGRRQAILETLAPLLLALLVLVPMSLAGIWLLIRHALRQVLAYRNAIAARGAGDLTPIDGGALPSEISPIAEAVNALMARLHRSLESERSFTANSAHELRTPLAETLAQVQRLRRDAPAGKLGTRAARIEESLNGLSRLSEKLMQLARAERGGLLMDEARDVSPVLSQVVEELRRGTGQRIELTLPDGAVRSIMDADALAIVLRNLVENALKHGAADQPVEVCLGADRALSVINGGAVVPAAELAHLTERFERAGSTTPGSGLGLAIARAIASGTGTSLQLASPPPGRAAGFMVRIELP